MKHTDNSIDLMVRGLHYAYRAICAAEYVLHVGGWRLGAFKEMKRLIAILVCLIQSVFFGYADFAPLPLRVGEIREARQNAIILFDQAKKKETLILQTDIAASREVNALFFMPLPSSPVVSTAPTNLFVKLQRIVQEKKLHYFEDSMFQTLGSGFSPKAKDGLQIVLRSTLHEHDVTAVRVESVDNFMSWVMEYIVRNRIKTEFDLEKVRDTVSAYLDDNIRFFLFDRVFVQVMGQQMHPLVIEFESATVYYPLRVNKLYDGPSDVQLMLLTETRIPSHRFEQIGFFQTEQVMLSRSALERLWQGFAERSNSPLNFQCFRLVDPRSWYKELNPQVSRKDYLRELHRLRRQAFARWDHDVSVSLVWGKDHNPKYERSPWPGLE